MEIKKFLDQTGLGLLWNKISGNFVTGDELTAVVEAVDEAKADLDSPTLTGTPKAPTPAADDSSEQIATTAFVQQAIQAYLQSYLQNTKDIGNISSENVITLENLDAGTYTLYYEDDNNEKLEDWKPITTMEVS